MQPSLLLLLVLPLAIARGHGGLLEEETPSIHSGSKRVRCSCIVPSLQNLGFLQAACQIVTRPTTNPDCATRCNKYGLIKLSKSNGRSPRQFPNCNAVSGKLDSFLETDWQVDAPLAREIPLLMVVKYPKISATFTFAGEGRTATTYRLTLDGKEYVAKVRKDFCDAEVRTSSIKALQYELESVLKVQKHFMGSQVSGKHPMPFIAGYALVQTDAEATCYTPSFLMEPLLYDWREFCQQNQCEKLRRELVQSGDRLKQHLKDVVDALRVVHDAGVAHLDIAPRNVMVGPDGGSYLIDFGNVGTTDGYGGSYLYSPPGEGPAFRNWPQTRAEADSLGFDLRKVDLWGVSCLIQEYIMGCTVIEKEIMGHDNKRPVFGSCIRNLEWQHTVDLLQRIDKRDLQGGYEVLAEAFEKEPVVIPEDQWF